MGPIQWKRIVGGVGLLLVTLAVGAAVLVATGDMTVVSTSGVSMQPTYREGDLVVVRSSDYSVGDVVAFTGDSGGTVLHRIVGHDGDRLVLQGDNNDWVDPERPRTSEVIGEAWLHVPGGGRTIAWLRGPIPASAMLAAVGLMLTRPAPGDERNGRGRLRSRLGRRTRRDEGGPDDRGGRRDRRDPGPHPGSERATGSAPPPPPGAPAPLRGPERPPAGPARAEAGLQARTLLGGALVVLLAAGALGALAASRPSQRVAEQDLRLEHRGELSYAASAPTGPVYDNGEVTTGDPLFLDLVDRVQVGFDYTLGGADLGDVQGRLDLDVEVTAGNGWNRTLPLVAGATFDGPGTTAEATLDLGELQQLLRDVEGATGVRTNTYVVAIVPTVEVEGTADGRAVADEFSERYEFRLDSKQLQPDTADEPVSSNGTEVLRSTRTGSVAVETRSDETLSAFGRHMTVSTARWFAGVTAALAAVVAVAALVYLRLRGPRTQADRISARYGRRIIDVDGGEGGESRTIIDVSTMGALVRLADHHDRLILHHRSDSGDTFMVDAGDTLYRHRIAPAPAQLRR